MNKNALNNNTESLFIKCECHSHMLEANFDAETEISTLELTIWEQDYRQFSLFQRLKFAILLLTGKKLWTDYILLDKNKTTQLRNFLTTILKKRWTNN
jgi:hypothetical protein